MQQQIVPTRTMRMSWNLPKKRKTCFRRHVEALTSLRHENQNSAKCTRQSKMVCYRKLDLAETLIMSPKLPRYEQQGQFHCTDFLAFRNVFRNLNTMTTGVSSRISGSTTPHLRCTMGPCSVHSWFPTVNVTRSHGGVLMFPSRDKQQKMIQT